MTANLLSKDDRHAAMMVRFAIRAQEEASKVLRPDVDDGSTLQMRIGLFQLLDQGDGLMCFICQLRLLVYLTSYAQASIAGPSCRGLWGRSAGDFAFSGTLYVYSNFIVTVMF